MYVCIYTQEFLTTAPIPESLTFLTGNDVTKDGWVNVHRSFWDGNIIDLTGLGLKKQSKIMEIQIKISHFYTMWIPGTNSWRSYGKSEVIADVESFRDDVDGVNSGHPINMG